MLGERPTYAGAPRGAQRASGAGVVLEPFWLILGVIAIACVLLWPLRAWQQSRYGRDEEEPGGDEAPLAPPKRRNRG